VGLSVYDGAAADPNAEASLALYRVRGPVERAIKRWQSVLDVDLLRAQAASPLAEVWLRGTLLYAMLIEPRAYHKLGVHWTRVDGEWWATWWRAWKRIKDEEDVCILSAYRRRKAGRNECLDALAKRPRR